MSRLPAPQPRNSPPARHVGELVDWAARRLDAAGLCFGHGTDNPLDEAAALVFHALGIEHAAAPSAYGWAVDPARARQARLLVERRIRTRAPFAYLTGRTWFAGLEMEVTADVLVPRSPIAELCACRFEPWVTAAQVRDVLDIGTGSGCIAIAAAVALPQARVDAADISHAALAVAARNIRRHGLAGRVRPVLSNVFAGVAGRPYDIVVSNPPYVPAAEMARLPDEYRREPLIGLAAGRHGLDIVRRILAGAAAHLKPAGILVVEVGDTEDAVRATWPSVPFAWLEFERGGGGVFVLTGEQVRRHRRVLSGAAH